MRMRVLAFLLCGLLSNVLLAATRPTPSATYGDGAKYAYGDTVLVEVRGTWRQMGQQYGYLLRQEMKDHYEDMVEDALRDGKNIRLSDMEDVAEDLLNQYPAPYVDFLRGVADTATIDDDEVTLLNAVEYYSGLFTSESDELDLDFGGCTAVAAWDDYTNDDPLVLGRNYDFDETYKVSAKYLMITVFHPEDGRGPFATIGYAGCVYVTNGLNADGFFLEMNNAFRSDTNDYSDERVAAQVSLFAMMQEADTWTQMDFLFETLRPDTAYNITTVDKTGAYCYEWGTAGVLKRSSDRRGLLVSTNHFVDTRWTGLPDIDPTDNSVIRRQHAIALAEKYRGDFDADTMQDFLAVDYEDGGVTFEEYTVYQIIAVPEKKTVWLQAPENFDWTEVDLSPFFVDEEPTEPIRLVKTETEGTDVRQVLVDLEVPVTPETGRAVCAAVEVNGIVYFLPFFSQTPAPLTRTAGTYRLLDIALDGTLPSGTIRVYAAVCQTTPFQITGAITSVAVDIR